MSYFPYIFSFIFLRLVVGEFLMSFFTIDLENFITLTETKINISYIEPFSNQNRLFKKFQSCYFGPIGSKFTCEDLFGHNSIQLCLNFSNLSVFLSSVRSDSDRFCQVSNRLMKTNGNLGLLLHPPPPMSYFTPALE